MNTAVFVKSLRYIDDNFKLTVSLSTWINDQLIQVNANIEKLYPIIFREDFELIDYLKSKIRDNDEYRRTDINKLLATEQHMLSYVRVLIHLNQEESFSDLMDVACFRGYSEVVKLLKSRNVLFTMTHYYVMTSHEYHGHKP